MAQSIQAPVMVPGHPSEALSSSVAIPPAPAAPRRRLESVDLLRGVVMVVMVLDHTRDFVHSGALHFDPTDLTQTTPLLFMTRWVTHFCAPVFVFLAGLSVYFQAMHGKSKAEIARFLVTRGLWLVVVEFTIVRFGYTFNLDYRFLGAMQVIWAIGISMIVLAGLIYLPLRVVAGFGIAMVVLHNAFDSVQVAGWAGPGSPAPSFWHGLWMVLHHPGLLPMFGSSGPVVMVLYPLIPWIGVMAMGYAFGSLYSLSPERRKRIMIALGGALLLAFCALRLANIYGDPTPWSIQRSAGLTALSFVNVMKYPPSLLFLLVTLGPSLIALGLFEGVRLGQVGRAVVTFGRVPMFFYLLQWPLVHGIAMLLSFASGKGASYISLGPNFNGVAIPPNAGFDLWVVYLCWAMAILILYPLCMWFADVKRRRRDWWLSYL